MDSVNHKDYQIHTFGCKVNTYDSGLIEKNLKSFGVNKLFAREDFGSSPISNANLNLNEDTNSITTSNSNSQSTTIHQPRVHILNTCAVTQEATKEAVKTVRRLKSKDPFCKVIITGCSAQVDTGSFENLPGVDLVVANSHKSFLPEIIDQYYKGEIKDKVFKSNIFKKEDLEVGGGTESQHTRSFLKIQDGCNSFCTYCIIPYARGKSRSIPANLLIRRIQEVHREGVQEVVLTGVHIGDYEDETSQTPFLLEDLIEAVLTKTKIPRIRLTSFEPLEVTDRLLELFQDDRLCPHFHMSIQSAQTQVLADMKRKYTQQDVIDSLNRIALKVPNAFVGMDVIVGFPTESLAMFQETCQTLANSPWHKIHVFPYSERNGTRATQYQETVPVSERKRRSQVLRELSNSRHHLMAQDQVGSVKKVLLLKNKEGLFFEGLSRDYWPVRINLQNLENTQVEFLNQNQGKEIDLRIQTVHSGDNLFLKGLLL